MSIANLVCGKPLVPKPLKVDNLTAAERRAARQTRLGAPRWEKQIRRPGLNPHWLDDRKIGH